MDLWSVTGGRGEGGGDQAPYKSAGHSDDQVGKVRVRSNVINGFQFR